MPKLSQNFLKGKMNKDLDERLVPKGEYRLAQNILISQSEENDVGAIENIKGNSVAHLFEGSGIGWFSNRPDYSNNNTIFVPVVDRDGRKRHFECIGYYADTLKKRVIWFITNWSGSISEKETNSLKTAGRRADETSVCAILLCNLDDVDSSSPNNLPPVHRLVAGHFLNFSKNHLITGVNVIDDLLFWTDNYNQPRKINISKAFGNPNYYDSEEKISVAKFAPYLPIMLHHNGLGHGTSLTNETNVESDYLKENFVRFSYRYKYKDGEYSTIAPFTQIVFAPLNDGIISNESLDKYGYEKIFQDTIVEGMQNHYNKIQLRIPLYSPEKLTLPEQNNQNQDTWINHLDIDKIEILVKQSNENIVKIAQTIDVKEDFASNINQQETVDINLNVENTNAVEYYKVTPSQDTTYFRYVYRYVYKSEEPFKSLPENQVTRVYDHVPIKAKSQELVGNRIIYGNYLENHPLPIDSKGNTGINYVISSTNKGDLEFGDTFGVFQYLSTSYKYHSIKQRRNYQVGIVLSDKFGRQSTVILSSNTDHPYLSDTYRVDNFNVPTGMSWSSFQQAESIGKSLAITFLDNKVIKDEYVYNGDVLSKKYNPNGWYSWRLVVKQKQQDYYNVYSIHPAENWNALSDSIDSSESGSSWLTLYGDNINKVPRIVNKDDANKIGASNSEIKLFPRIIKDQNQQGDGYSIYSSFVNSVKVLGIGTPKEQGLVDEDNISYSFVGSTKKVNQIAELPKLGGNNTPVYTTTSIALQDAENFDVSDPEVNKYIILKSRNYFLRKGHYVEGDNIEDKTVATLNLASGGAITNQSKLRFVADLDDASTEGIEAQAGLMQTLSGIKKDHYIDGMDIEDSPGESYKAIVVDIDKDVIGEKNNHYEYVFTLNRNITTDSAQVVFKEFTTIESIVDVSQGVSTFQRIQVSKAQDNVNANDVLTFRTINGSPISVSRGLSVFETEPFESNLDIFYETSTSGLISDLNSESNIIINNPSNINITNNIFYENQSASNGNNVIGQLSASSAVDNPNAIFSFSVIDVITENEDMQTGEPSFTVDPDGNLRVIPGFVWNPQEGEEEKNKFELIVQVTELTAPGEPTANEIIELELQNSPPTIENEINEENGNTATVVPVNNIPGQMAGQILFECEIENGSARDPYTHRHLNVALTSDSDLAYGPPTVPSGIQFGFTTLADSNHYIVGSPGSIFNFGMLSHRIVSPSDNSSGNSKLQIIATGSFHAGAALYGSVLDFDGGVLSDPNVNEARPEEERTIIINLNDGGAGTTDEPTEWHPQGETVLTKIILEPATLENGLYRIYFSTLGIATDGFTTVEDTPGLITDINWQPTFNTGVGDNLGGGQNVMAVNQGTGTTAPSGPQGFQEYNIHVGNRIYFSTFAAIPLSPDASEWNEYLQNWEGPQNTVNFVPTQSDGNIHIVYRSFSSSGSGNIFKRLVVNENGYVIDIQNA